VKTNNKPFLIFSVTFLIAILYIIYRWPYTPADVIEDSKRLGPWGLIIDAVFVYVGYRWWKGRKTQQ